MTALLQDKNIVIYGAGGGIGAGVARTFAREGARLFLAGRTAASLQAVAADFVAPIATGASTNFITATAAARRMIEQGSGVIMTLTSGSSHGTAPMMGGTGPADAAVETFLRYLAAETGEHGVRVVGLWTAGVPESFSRPGDENVSRRASGMTPEGIEAFIGPRTLLQRAPRLAQVADTAAFLASDRAGAITCTITNVTCGLVRW
jgi:NAD(P)-dependent dehydrogenase (short-subunit alcohol dehydrogenase family)